MIESSFNATINWIMNEGNVIKLLSSFDWSKITETQWNTYSWKDIIILSCIVYLCLSLLSSKSQKEKTKAEKEVVSTAASTDADPINLQDIYPSSDTVDSSVQSPVYDEKFSSIVNKINWNDDSSTLSETPKSSKRKRQYIFSPSNLESDHCLKVSAFPSAESSPRGELIPEPLTTLPQQLADPSPKHTDEQSIIDFAYQVTLNESVIVPPEIKSKIDELLDQSPSFSVALTHRLRSLKLLRKYWKRGDIDRIIYELSKLFDTLATHSSQTETPITILNPIIQHTIEFFSYIDFYSGSSPGPSAILNDAPSKYMYIRLSNQSNISFHHAIGFLEIFNSALRIKNADSLLTMPLIILCYHIQIILMKSIQISELFKDFIVQTKSLIYSSDYKINHSIDSYRDDRIKKFKQFDALLTLLRRKLNCFLTYMDRLPSTNAMYGYHHKEPLNDLISKFQVVTDIPSSPRLSISPTIKRRSVSPTRIDIKSRDSIKKQNSISESTGNPNPIAGVSNPNTNTSGSSTDRITSVIVLKLLWERGNIDSLIEQLTNIVQDIDSYSYPSGSDMNVKTVHPMIQQTLEFFSNIEFYRSSINRSTSLSTSTGLLRGNLTFVQGVGFVNVLCTMLKIMNVQDFEVISQLVLAYHIEVVINKVNQILELFSAFLKQTRAIAMTPAGLGAVNVVLDTRIKNFKLFDEYLIEMKVKIEEYCSYMNISIQVTGPVPVSSSSSTGIIGKLVDTLTKFYTLTKTEPLKLLTSPRERRLTK